LRLTTVSAIAYAWRFPPRFVLVPDRCPDAPERRIRRPSVRGHAGRVGGLSIRRSVRVCAGFHKRDSGLRNRDPGHWVLEQQSPFEAPESRFPSPDPRQLQMRIEPATQPFEPFDSVHWLSGAREAVGLVGEADKLDLLAELPERDEELFPLRDWAAQVIL
jgi:hypothetical protein